MFVLIRDRHNIAILTTLRLYTCTGNVQMTSYALSSRSNIAMVIKERCVSVALTVTIETRLLDFKTTAIKCL